MARQSDSALRTLLRMQATSDRQLAAMHPAAMERAGYWFREVSVPEPAASQAQADAPQPAAPRSAEAQSGEPWPVPAQAEIDAEAERYAVICRSAWTSAHPNRRSSRPCSVPWAARSARCEPHDAGPLFLWPVLSHRARRRLTIANTETAATHRLGLGQ